MIKSRLPIITILTIFFIVIHIVFDDGDPQLLAIRETLNAVLFVGCGLVVVRLLRSGVHLINDLSMDMVLTITGLSLMQGLLLLNTNLAQQGIQLGFENWMPTDEIVFTLIAPFLFRMLVIPALASGTEQPPDDARPPLES